MIRRLISSFSGGNYLPGAQKRMSECGAILVVGGAPWSNAQRGVESQEAFLNMASFECRYYLAVNEKMPSNAGEPIARFQSDNFSRDVTMEGEVVGAVPYGIATACEIMNDTDTMGDGSGDFLLDEVTEKQGRADQRTLSIKLSSDPGIQAV